MNISKLTIGQQKSLLDSLEKQVSKRTPSETSTMNELRDILSEEIDGGDAKGFKRCGNHVKMINLDTFGERYNNCWIKIYESSKGEFFTSSYIGKRIYIN